MLFADNTVLIVRLELELIVKQSCEEKLQNLKVLQLSRTKTGYMEAKFGRSQTSKNVTIAGEEVAQTN